MDAARKRAERARKRGDAQAAESAERDARRLRAEYQQINPRPMRGFEEDPAVADTPPPRRRETPAGKAAPRRKGPAMARPRDDPAEVAERAEAERARLERVAERAEMERVRVAAERAAAEKRRLARDATRTAARQARDHARRQGPTGAGNTVAGGDVTSAEAAEEITAARAAGRSAAKFGTVTGDLHFHVGGTVRGTPAATARISQAQAQARHLLAEDGIQLHLSRGDRVQIDGETYEIS